MPQRPGTHRWQILPGDIQAEAKLQIELGVHPIVARLLVQRGLTSPADADKFLNPSLDRLHDPFLLPDAELACERLKRALHHKEKILIHGDYDGDGLTSAALWTRILRSLGGEVAVFVPHRRRDGYDIRMGHIEQAKLDGVTLIVTTDCGIQRVEEVEYAREAGIDVIITDHHTPRSNGDLPKAVAVVNPHRIGSRYPFPDLAGVGVAFRVGEALTRYLGHNPDKYRRAFLDLVVIGTVTDIMPLLDENRILVKHGLEALQQTKKPGLRALINVCGFANKTLSTRSIGFGIGPRLNAASRIDETQLALDLLMTKDDQEATRLARRLDELNMERREEQSKVVEEAVEQIARQDMGEARCLVVTGEGWKSGLVGLVAGRIADQFHRPCIAIAMDTATGRGRGSARSIHAFNIFNAIDACKDLLIEYGGHSHAAGLAIHADQVPDFKAQMNRLAAALLTDEDMQPTLEVSVELDPSEVCHQLVRQIEAMEPFGNGNPVPLFVSRDSRVLEVVRIGSEKQHLKLILKADGLNGKDQVEALWWKMGALADQLDAIPSLDVCYRPEINEWNGTCKIQFMLEDFKPPEF